MESKLLITYEPREVMDDVIEDLNEPMESASKNPVFLRLDLEY